LKKKLSKMAKNTIVKNYGRLKGGPGARPPPLNTPLLLSVFSESGLILIKIKMVRP